MIAALPWIAALALWIAVAIVCVAPLGSRVERRAAYLTIAGAFILILYMIWGA